MLNVAKEMKKSLNLLCNNDSKVKSFKLEESDWSSLEKILNF